MFQLKDLWQEEDSEINFAADRAESDDEDPDFAAYTPRIDLEEPARASKDSDDDDCYIVDPLAARPLAYALPVGDPAGAPAKGKGKKAADKPKKNAPPTMSGRSRGPRVAPVESG